MDERVCVVCGVPLERRITESNMDFDKRITCGKACFGKRLSIVKTKEIVPRPCKVCGAMIPIGENDNYTRYNLRKTCGADCSGRAKGISKIKDVADRPCVVCGKVMSRRPEMRKTISDRNRITCSPSCRAKLIARNRNPDTYLRGHKIMLPAKPCVICGDMFERRMRESPGDFSKRETCSKECGDKLSGDRNRIPDPERYCEMCGVRMERSATEKPKQFLKRVTCGGSCRAERAWRTRFAETEYAPRMYALNFPAIREMVYDRDNRTCQECGKSLQPGDANAHHINYEKMDNRMENLITLCRSCHTKTNFQRDYWENRYTQLMKERIGWQGQHGGAETATMLSGGFTAAAAHSSRPRES